VVNIRVLSGRVVTPDEDVVDFLNSGSSALSNLADGSVLVESSQSGEVSLGDGGSVVRSDKSVGVGGVSDNADLASLLGDSIHSSSLSLEDLSVSLEEISSFHTRASGSSTDHYNDIGILEGNKRVSCGDNAVDTVVGSIIELHHESLKNLLGRRELQKL